jgi:nucleoside-diphosphate-sugar epimerase
MNIFLAGATGAIGRRLLPMLVSAGHTVTGTTQHPDKMMSIHSAGATPMVVNALDEKEVLAAVRKAQPEIIIHQLTAIPSNLNLRPGCLSRLCIVGTCSCIAFFIVSYLPPSSR